MSEQKLKLGDIVVNKKEFHASKQAMDLNSVKTGKILVSYKFKQSDDRFKYSFGYLHDGDVIRLLCIILPQMIGYIKYFDNGGKKCFIYNLRLKCVFKYAEIWNKIKSSLNSKFYSQPIYDDKYIKAKVFQIPFTNYKFVNVIKFRNYICIAAICIDCVLREKLSSTLLKTVQI